jgi:hypothetical protein
MCKRIITSFLILAFINLLYGCYSQEKAFKEELVVNSEKIMKVVFPDGNVTTFNEQGGTYSRIESGIMGISLKGEKIILPLEHIKEIRITEVPSITLTKVEGKTITEVIVNPDIIYKFNQAGGRYDQAQNKIKGVLVDDREISFKPEQIKEIHLEFPSTIGIDKLKEDENVLISSIILLNSNRIIKFDDNKGRFVKQKAFISGTTTLNEKVTIDASEILYVMVERTNVAGTVFTTLAVIVGIIAVIGLIALATKESCPFVYSYDGEKFVFDAEPLGGATTRGLQRSELSKLEKLKETNGKYNIMVRNEVEETQYLDKLSLFIVDHNPDYEIYSDIACNIHAVKSLKSSLKAEDEGGRDLTKFIEKPDNLYWQSKLPIEEPISKNNHRHQLNFTFPKPTDSKSAKLVINAGTTLWGSNMIREMLLLYGDSVDDWYSSIDNSEFERETMMRFIEREELYLLKLWVKEADGWKMQNMIQGGGPFVNETRSYDLDLSNVTSDSLFIKINPPYGFWTMDYLAIEYESNISPQMNEVEMLSATDCYDADVSEILSTADDNYLIMPLVGDYFITEFEAPPLDENLVRTIFLKSTGYYEIHLPKDQPIQSQKIYEIGIVPGKIVEYSNNRYKEWINNNK